MDSMKDNSDIFMTWEEASKIPCYNPDIPPLSGHILALFDPDTPRRTVKDFVYHTRKHPNTIKKHIRELVRAGLMRKHGKGKATWSTL
jgi:hypothetical protein